MKIQNELQRNCISCHILKAFSVFFSVPPSQSCGPYRVYSNENYTMFETLSITVTTWPVVIKDIFLFLGTVGFLIPVMIILG